MTTNPKSMTVINLADLPEVPHTFLIMSGDVDITKEVLDRLYAAARGLRDSHDSRAHTMSMEADTTAKAVGLDLHATGGLHLMQACYYRVREYLGAETATLLDYAWHGVGDWQC